MQNRRSNTYPPPLAFKFPLKSPKNAVEKIIVILMRKGRQRQTESYIEILRENILDKIS